MLAAQRSDCLLATRAKPCLSRQNRCAQVELDMTLHSARHIGAGHGVKAEEQLRQPSSPLGAQRLQVRLPRVCLLPSALCDDVVSRQPLSDGRGRRNVPGVRHVGVQPAPAILQGESMSRACTHQQRPLACMYIRLQMSACKTRLDRGCIWRFKFQ